MTECVEPDLFLPSLFVKLYVPDDVMKQSPSMRLLSTFHEYFIGLDQLLASLPTSAHPDPQFSPNWEERYILPAIKRLLHLSVSSLPTASLQRVMQNVYDRIIDNPFSHSNFGFHFRCRHPTVPHLLFYRRCRRIVIRTIIIDAVRRKDDLTLYISFHGFALQSLMDEFGKHYVCSLDPPGHFLRSHSDSATDTIRPSRFVTNTKKEEEQEQEEKGDAITDEGVREITSFDPSHSIKSVASTDEDLNRYVNAASCTETHHFCAYAAPDTCKVSSPCSNVMTLFLRATKAHPDVDAVDKAELMIAFLLSTPGSILERITRSSLEEAAADHIPRHLLDGNDANLFAEVTHALLHVADNVMGARYMVALALKQTYLFPIHNKQSSNVELYNAHKSIDDDSDNDYLIPLFENPMICDDLSLISNENEQTLDVSITDFHSESATAARVAALDTSAACETVSDDFGTSNDTVITASSSPSLGDADPARARIVYSKEELLRFKVDELIRCRPLNLPDMTILSGPSNGRMKKTGTASTNTNATASATSTTSSATTATTTKLERLVGKKKIGKAIP